MQLGSFVIVIEYSKLGSLTILLDDIVVGAIKFFIRKEDDVGGRKTPNGLESVLIITIHLIAGPGTYL